MFTVASGVKRTHILVMGSVASSDTGVISCLGWGQLSILFSADLVLLVHLYCPLVRFSCPFSSWSLQQVLSSIPYWGLLKV